MEGSAEIASHFAVCLEQLSNQDAGRNGQNRLEAKEAQEGHHVFCSLSITAASYPAVHCA